MNFDTLPSPNIGKRGQLLRTSATNALNQLIISASGYPGGKHPDAASLSAFFAAAIAALGGAAPAPSPAPSPAGAPVNTVLPTAQSAVIGQPLQLADGGTWTSGTSTIVSVTNWFVGGVAKGPAYTPLEADRGVAFEADVLCTNASGGTTVRIALGNGRRTAATIGYNYGALTPNGWGYVAIADLPVAMNRTILGTGVTAPTTWTVAAATAGDTDWTRTAGNTPKKAAALSLATYTFVMTATFGDGVTETQTLTITRKANVATASHLDPDFAWKTTLKNAVEPTSGTIELALGVPPTWQWDIADIRCTTNRITLTVADVSRMRPFKGFVIRGFINVRLQSLRTDNTNAQAVGGRFILYPGGGDGVASDNLIIDDYRHVGVGSTNAAGVAVLRLAQCNNTVISNTRLSCVGTGITQDPGGSALAVTFNGLTIDTFYGNGMIIGGNSIAAGKTLNGLTFNDVLIMRPTRIANDNDHLDFIQLSDTASGGFVRFRRVIAAEAGGNANAQMFFGGGNGPLDISLRGLLAAGRTNWGIHQSVGNNTTIDYFSLMKHNGSTTGVALAPVSDVAIDGPHLYLSNDGSGAADGLSGVNTASKGIVYGSKQPGTGWTIDASVRAFGGTNANNPAALTPLFALGNPRTNLEAISNAAWLAMTDAEVIATMKSVNRPANGSVIDGESPIAANTGDWHPTVLAA